MYVNSHERGRGQQRAANRGKLASGGWIQIGNLDV